MINTVTLNPSLDYTVSVENLPQGGITYYSSPVCEPGGKGINVSLLLSSLGVETRALCIGAGAFGREAARLLEERGCRAEFFFLPGGSSRLNIQILCGDGKETKLNGLGPAMTPEAVNWAEEKLSKLQPGDGLVLAGAIPPSLPEDTYNRLLKQAEGKDVLTVVDAAGEALLSALPRRPFLIKPNRKELGDLFGVCLEELPAVRDCARALQDKGARNVLVSLEEKGALLVQEDGKTLFCRAAKGETVSTVGAGDSMVAGFLYGLKLHGTLEGALRWGVSAGSATAFCAGIAQGDSVKTVYPRVGNVYPIA